MPKFYAAAVAAVVTAFASSAADAGVVVNITEQGANVVAEASGFLDLAGLQYSKSVVGGAVKNMNPSLARIATGASGLVNVYTSFTGPANFGSNKQIDTLLQSGIAFVFNGSKGELSIANTYLSNTGFTSSTTWTNKTLAALGAVTGRYDYMFNGQMVSISVGSTLETPVYTAPAGPSLPGGVPEPSSWAMLILGMGAVGSAMRRRVRGAAARFA